jgi:hypothetical protein
MDASRYKKHYDSLKGDGSFSDAESCEFVRSLWQRLLDAYIAPNGPREVNLPCSIRDCLLSIPNYTVPPKPETLDRAVAKVYELMEESVLMPFIYSCQCAAPYSAPWEATQSDDNIYLRGSLDERLLNRNRGSVSPPPSTEFLSHSYTAPSTSSRSKHISPFSVNLGWSRHSHHLSHWSVGSPGSMVEDTDAFSPRARTPVTPPSTPPTPDSFIRGGSPKPLHMQRSADKAWKRVTGKLSWNKKKGPHSNPDGMDYQ